MSRKLGRVTDSSAGFILPNIEEDDSEKEICDRLTCLLFGLAD
ncbi:MAG: hypothetical protein V7K71_03695 [Nostoc sp.]